jgi:hypothetical protein
MSQAKPGPVIEWFDGEVTGPEFYRPVLKILEQHDRQGYWQAIGAFRDLVGYDMLSVLDNPQHGVWSNANNFVYYDDDVIGPLMQTIAPQWHSWGYRYDMMSGFAAWGFWPDQICRHCDYAEPRTEQYLYCTLWRCVTAFGASCTRVQTG